MKTFANTTISLNVADLITKACKLAAEAEKAACEYDDMEEALALMTEAGVYADLIKIGTGYDLMDNSEYGKAIERTANRLAD